MRGGQPACEGWGLFGDIVKVSGRRHCGNARREPAESVPRAAGKGAEDGHSSNPAYYPDKKDAGKDADAVNGYVTFGWAAAGYEGLVIFIETGKGDAEYAGHYHKGKAADSVYIQREGHRYREHEIFRDMPKLAYIVMDAVGVMLYLFLRQIFFQNPVGGSDDFPADF